MKRSAIADGLAPQPDRRRAWRDRLRSPRALALGAVIVWTAALLLLGAGARLESDAHQREQAVRSLQDQVARIQRPAGETRLASAPTADLAGLEAQDGDALRLLKAASDAGLALGKVEYRNEPIADLGAVLRTASLSLPGNYSKVRQFLASALREMPGCYLVELRVDRREVRSAEGQISLQLACVYRADGTIAQSGPPPQPAPR